MSTNLNDDYADGLDDGPSREEIETVVLEFDDANNDWSARADFDRHGDYEISVKHTRLGLMRQFNRLWEFVDWTYMVEAPVARSMRRHLEAELDKVAA